MTFLPDQDAPGQRARFIEPVGHEGLVLAGSRDAVLVTCNRDDFPAPAKPISMPASWHWSDGQSASPHAANFSTGCKPVKRAVCATTSILPERV